MQTTLAERMAAFATGLRYEDLGRDVAHEVKRVIIDSLGCALGAWHEQPCVIARRVACTMSSLHGGTLWGTRHLAPPDWAAFANGCLVRYLDYNDTYLSKEPAHPSDNIPAAIAAGQSARAGGRELIAAIVIAYEVQCRLCDAACIRARGWDHVTYGAFSTALAAGRLLGLEQQKMRHAVGIAGVASAALRQSRVGELSHWKGAAFANAARHGVFAAMLAAEGMTGPSPIFEGEKGFEKLVSGPLEAIGGPFAANARGTIPDDGFMIRKSCIKYWPAEYHAQSAIAAALKLREQLGITGSGESAIDAIDSIVVESHDAAVDIIGSEPQKWTPDSRETADHSLPYIVAAALADGQVTSRQFARQRYTDPKLLDLVRRVKVVRNAELSSLYPRSVANILTVRSSDGRTATARVDNPPGHCSNPLTDAQLLAKYHSLADPVLGVLRAQEAADWVWRLEEIDDISQLMPLIEVRL
ncbi:MAG TPA: MmgE/PrpD family protein [Tepidisphaeraceae bacterium]|nr:MmgE/PrpD family protein [Tepidisphaeraceae bacterium]